MSEQQPSEAHKHYFISLVTMLSMSAMQQLGKLKNPATGKTEISLEGAQVNIDLLDMLEAKTRGNLDKDEAKLLKDTLSTLKLNYVETAETEKTKTPSAKPEAKKEEKNADEQDQIQTPDTAKEHKDPKFHKSYE